MSRIIRTHPARLELPVRHPGTKKTSLPDAAILNTTVNKNIYFFITDKLYSITTDKSNRF